MLDHPYVLTAIVEEQEEGLMVRDIVCGRLGLTRGLLRRMKKGGGIFLNGQRDYLSRRVRAGDQIQIVFFDEATELQPEALPLDIVYEDDYLLVVNKPRGWRPTPPGAIKKARWPMPSPITGRFWA